MNKQQKMHPRVAKALEMRRVGEDWAGALVEAQCLQAIDSGGTSAETSAILRKAAKYAGHAAEKMCKSVVGFRQSGPVAHYGPVLPRAVANPIALVVACNEGQQIGAIMGIDELCHHVDLARGMIVGSGGQIALPALWIALAEATEKNDGERAFDFVSYRYAMGKRGDELRDDLEARGARGVGMIPAVVALAGVKGQRGCGVIVASMMPEPLVEAEAFG